MFISRRAASRIACKLSYEDIRRYNNRPLMDVLQCREWNDGLSSYIESVYTGKATDFSAIAAEFNSNINRKFQTEKGKIIDFCQLLGEYLGFMCHPENNGKRYTLKEFNNFIARYTEI